ncbi:MAG TPA: CCA tRNA nucleotidyltransferase [Terracidiphilus sp.]|jgi:tRNA nucleotidyltransferase/poly(A) polymerase
MPDYIYLLEHRLSADQRNALNHLREAAREAGTILFLTGDAVRDLTSGHAVHELEVAIHGNALKLKKSLEKLGAKVWGENEASRSLYLCFPGTVRVDLVSTHRIEYPKPGHPVFHPASIQEDLRRRDFTANSMAISLNEGSFGLLMDPLNGAADIESRALRLVSNYGFLEESSLLIRATRYRARLSWEMDPRTLSRYENAKAEGVIQSLSDHARSQELEQIGHEEDGLKVLRALEDEGWMKVLCPAWTASKADEEKLKALHELAVQLLMQGVHADMSAAQMQLLTAKLSPKDLAGLKKLMLRPGFVEEWNSLDTVAAGFAKVLLAKQNAVPSAGYKLFTTYDPEAVLWLGFTSKVPAVQERFNLFLKVWPEARQRIPHALMQEMRITPELPGYADLVQAIFLELIDEHLTTPEEMRAYLEPHSPPAPPPQVSIKKTRARRSAESKLKEQAYEEDEEQEETNAADDDLDEMGGDDDEMDLGMNLPKIDLEREAGEEESEEEEESEAESEPEPAAARSSGKKGAPKQTEAGRKAPVEKAPVSHVVESPAKAPKAGPAAQPKSEAKPEAAPDRKSAANGAKAVASSGKAKQAPAKATPPVKKPGASPAVTAQNSKSSQPAAKSVKAPAKAAAKAPAKTAAKAPAKTNGKTAAAKHAPAKAKAGHSPAPKPGHASHGAKHYKPQKKASAKAAKKR